MADIALDPTRGASAGVQDLARQITAAQGPEITTMSGWLRSWGEDVPTSAEAGGMTGMDHGGSSMAGMMSDEDMAGLRGESGAGFDQRWLSMMVEHHTGAIEQARTELDAGRYEPARDPRPGDHRLPDQGDRHHERAARRLRVFCGSAAAQCGSRTVGPRDDPLGRTLRPWAGTGWPLLDEAGPRARRAGRSRTAPSPSVLSRRARWGRVPRRWCCCTAWPGHSVTGGRRSTGWRLTRGWWRWTCWASGRRPGRGPATPSASMPVRCWRASTSSARENR